MRTKAHQSKLMLIVRSPVRVLCKARDIYVRTLTNYSTKMIYTQSKALPAAGQQSSALLRSLSAAPSRSNKSEDHRVLPRAASVRTPGHINELDMNVKQLRLRCLLLEQSNSSSMVLPKSCSIGMEFMGRIEEENEYEEFSERVRPEFYQSSRSYATYAV